MFAAILPILASIPGLLGDYFKRKNEIEQARLEKERQIEVAQQQMAREIAKAQLELNKTIVASTGSKFKYFTFVMWFGPYMVGVIKPSWALAIFDNLQKMPDWYTQSCMLLMFTVWGISVSAPVVGNIFSSLGSFMANRRDYKIELAKVNREAYFAAYRAKHGPLSPKFVKEQDEIFDQLDKENNGN